MLKEFKEFIMRGNVVDLAVAVLIGAAFGQVVTSFTNNVLMAAIAMVFGKPNFDDTLIFSANDSSIRFGAFLTSVVNFLIIAVALFFVVKAMNKAMEFRKPTVEEEAEATEIDLLTEIRDALVERG